jgi:two-component system chemotaxis sensor kinase CheA
MSNTQPARDEFFDSLLGDFLDESGQLLDRLNENLLQMDEWVRALGEDHHERCDEDLVNEMFRSAHSLKGLSAMLGLKDINCLTHKVENVFDAARKDQITVNGEVVELMFQAVDRLVGLVDGLKDQDHEPVEFESVAEGITRVLQAAGAERNQSSQADAERALAAEEPPPEAPSVEAAAEIAPPAPAPTLPPPAAAAAEVPAAPVPDAFDNAYSDAPPPAPRPEPDVSRVSVFDGLTDEAEICDKYLSIFIDEAELSLDELTETLLALEGGGNRESLGKLLITSHRIKGSAASVGLNRAAKLAHFMEDLLQNLLNFGGTLSRELTDAMLKCTDGLRQYVDSLRRGYAFSDRFADLARDLLAAQNGTVAAPPPAPCPVAKNADPAAADVSVPRSERAEGTDESRARLAARAPEGASGWLGEVVFSPAVPLVGLKAQLIYEKLCNLGDLFAFEPPVERLEELEDLERVVFGLTSERPREVLNRHLRIAGVERVDLSPFGHSGAADPRPVADTSVAEAPRSERSQSAEPTPVAPPSAAVAPPAASKPRKEAPQATSETTRKPVREPAAKREADDAQDKSRGGDGSKPTETLRVDIERLDELMNLAGQLVISKARFSQIADRFKVSLGSRQSSNSLTNVFNTLERLAGADPGRTHSEMESVRNQARRLQNDLEAVRHDVAALAQVRLAMNDLFEAVHQLDRVTDGIQQSVMSTRMVPIGPLFSRFKRVVRDITRSNGKQVRLVIDGEKTELDKRMIDELGDPLIHMVRNSADHGIELPEVRQAAGKPPEGTIHLDAFHRGNCIVIEVRDDGKGLDADRILQKAVEKGLVNAADAEKLTRSQIYNLIWEPGLSTAEKITEVSGRGMGMDIVKSKIDDLNGMVDIDSTPGEGTTITIKLPLTLAILPSLMVEIDRDIFAMPIESVAEIVRVASKEILTIHGVEAAQVRGRVVSVLRLNEVFDWHTAAAPKAPAENDETTLVIVGERGHELGLAVDQVLGEEDVVIKSMAENYRNVQGIAGASILGDGRVSLILDVVALISMASAQGNSGATN